MLVFFFSPNIFGRPHVDRISRITEHLFKYAATVTTIDPTVFHVAQLFFKQCYSIDKSAFDSFWSEKQLNSDERSDFLDRMENHYEILLTKLSDDLNLETITDDIRETFKTRVILCLIPFVEHKPRARAHVWIRDADKYIASIMKILLKTFLKSGINFEFSDEHFIDKIRGFVYYTNDKNDGNTDILHTFEYASIDVLIVQFSS